MPEARPAHEDSRSARALPAGLRRPAPIMRRRLGLLPRGLAQLASSTSTRALDPSAAPPTSPSTIAPGARRRPPAAPATSDAARALAEQRVSASSCPAPRERARSTRAPSPPRDAASASARPGRPRRRRARVARLAAADGFAQRRERLRPERRGRPPGSDVGQARRAACSSSEPASDGRERADQRDHVALLRRTGRAGTRSGSGSFPTMPTTGVG